MNVGYGLAFVFTFMFAIKSMRIKCNNKVEYILTKCIRFTMKLSIGNVPASGYLLKHACLINYLSLLCTECGA